MSAPPAPSFCAADLADPAKLRNLLEQITADPSVLDRLPADELDKAGHLVSPYSAVADPSGRGKKWTCLSFTNLRQEYIKKLVITGIIGFLYRKCDEYGRLWRDTVDNMDDMAAAEAQLMTNQHRQSEIERELVELIRERDALAAAIARDTPVNEEHKAKYAAVKTSLTEAQILAMRDFEHVLLANTDNLRLTNARIAELDREVEGIQGFGKRFIIRQFLDSQFKFNPDKHVRSSYSDRAANPAAQPGATTTHVSRFVPPDDTFHMFQYYIDSNYEELRAVAERVYRMTPDLDVGLSIYGEFESKAAAESFIEENRQKTITDIRAIENGSWAFIESFKANRDRIEAYRGTIVEDILNQVQSDAKIGAQLMADVHTRRRRENVRELGPDPAPVRQYMADRGAPDVEASTTPMTEDEQKHLHAAHVEQKAEYERKLVEAADREEPAPRDTVRVNVFKMTDGGRGTAKSHFFTKATAPTDPMSLVGPRALPAPPTGTAEAVAASIAPLPALVPVDAPIAAPVARTLPGSFTD